MECNHACPYNTLAGCKVKVYNGICPLSNMASVSEVKPMTNADRIRAMSDEQLVEMFQHDLYEYVQYKVNWCGENDMTCTEYLLEWLKQPAEDHP